MSLLPRADTPGTPSTAAGVLYQESALNTPAPEESKLLNSPPMQQANHVTEEKETPSNEATRARSHRLKWILAGVLALVVLIAAIVPAAVVTSNKSKNNRSSSPPPGSDNTSGTGDNNSSPTQGPDVPDAPSEKITTGGDGSIVVTENGNFTYKNPFGGYWVYDAEDPFNNGARAQSWSPALNETWKWGKDVIRGVNLGGWLVTEPFIAPALFEKYSTAPVPPIDEYTLSRLMRADGSINDLEKHYKTFITEKDFAEIAGAGLNWVRLPLGFWAIQTFDDDPYLEGVSWKYVVKALQWARKYGLRVNLDLHAHPGSQNGWNHSGYKGGINGINWLKGLMGIANAQRSLDYIRILTEFISQEQYAPVVPMFGIVNEPRMEAFGRPALEAFYYEAYKVARDVTGIGAGKGPIISIHDGFDGEYADWFGFLSGADRVALDTHPYVAFDGPNGNPLDFYPSQPCSRWGDRTNQTQQLFGIAISGEFSAAINDCGLWVADSGAAYAGDCTQWENWQTWDQTTKTALKTFVLASMDALQHYFFWTWRIGESIETGTVRAPFWAYKLGLENGWMPTDPREAVGICQSLGVPMANPFSGTFQPWQIGNDPAAQPAATYVWPPASLIDMPQTSLLPTYAPTGPIIKLQGAQVPNGVDGGDGWFNDDDTTLMFARRADCTYPNAYTAWSLPAPVAPVCPVV